MGERDQMKGQPAPTEPNLTPLSNSIRLSVREWLFAGLFTALLVSLTPWLWTKVEKFDFEPDYRIPYSLRYDYWLYARFARLAGERYPTLLLGDSVVWGDYTTRHETLSHYLNEQLGREHFANLGLEGAFPLALSGLIEYYAGSVADKNVVLMCNPLWLRSPQTDMQDDKATDFDHPRLGPQFVPRVPSYKEEMSPRIGAVVERAVPLNSWASHLQQAYFNQSDLASWTLEHPYDNPLEPLARGLPSPDEPLRHLPQPWYRTIPLQDFPWVDLDTSLQWPAFQHAVRTLQRRGNRVFVVVGPLNEHLLKPGSRQRYQQVKATIAAWLEAEQIPHLVPEPLPSDLYGDTSHPLAAGYALLARRLLEQPTFRRTVLGANQ
jgi:hypothetical protein